MAQFLRASQTINSADTMFSGLLLLSFMGLGHGFFFRYSLRVATDNKTEYFEERRNFTQPKDAIIGLFDAVTGITQGLGEAIQDFEPSLDVEDKENDLRRKDINQDSDEKDPNLGMLGRISQGILLIFSKCSRKPSRCRPVRLPEAVHQAGREAGQ